MGDRSLIQLPVSLWGEAFISIGNETHIGSNSWLQALRTPEDPAVPMISIGDRCVFSGDMTITAIAGVQIGNDVMIGRNVHISDHSHHFNDVTKPVHAQGLTKAGIVKIGAGCWIGQGAVICPGVSIGKNSVIGANSIVKTDVPDFHVAAGIPARLIREIGAT